MTHSLRILHTSDWHLGRSLHNRKRYGESEAFLQWLVEILHTESIQILLIAGDVFDTTTPGNRAQEQYYRFLQQAGQAGCRHVVVTGGNHDSPTFLDAPKVLLHAFNVHVRGQAAGAETGGSLADEALLLCDDQGRALAVVCAVPYLRDRDICRCEAGESADDRDRRRVQGIAEHYRQVLDAAEKLQADLPARVPLVVMGHLFTVGGISDDGVRDLYVGSLGGVSADLFPENADYVALGHLHTPQMVGGNPSRRYSGSPLPMSFQEAGKQKSVAVVEFSLPEGAPPPATASAIALPPPEIRLLPVPRFQRLEQVEGDWQAIETALAALAAQGDSIWLDVAYTGTDPMPDLYDRLEKLLVGTRLDLVRHRNNQIMNAALSQSQSMEALQDLDEEAVFLRCLDAHDVPPESREELFATYRDVLQSIREADSAAE